MYVVLIMGSNYVAEIDCKKNLDKLYESAPQKDKSLRRQGLMTPGELRRLRAGIDIAQRLKDKSVEDVAKDLNISVDALYNRFGMWVKYHMADQVIADWFRLVAEVRQIDPVTALNAYTKIVLQIIDQTTKINVVNQNLTVNSSSTQVNGVKDGLSVKLEQYQQLVYGYIEEKTAVEMGPVQTDNTT